QIRAGHLDVLEDATGGLSDQGAHRREGRGAHPATDVARDREAVRIGYDRSTNPADVPSELPEDPVELGLDPFQPRSARGPPLQVQISAMHGDHPLQSRCPGSTPRTFSRTKGARTCRPASEPFSSAGR